MHRTYDDWKTTEPDSYADDESLGYCDCCTKWMPLTKCWAYAMETWACDECRGIEDDNMNEHIGINPLAPAEVIAEQVKTPIITKGIRVHYADLIAALVKSQPDPIRFVADARDLDERAEHITTIGRAFAKYIEELVDDTAYKLNTGILVRDVHFQILDSIDQAAGQMSRISEDLAEGSDW